MADIWIDTDLALGAARGDVDDGFAIAALLAAAARDPSIRIRGVSTVFGNTAVTTATRCARALLAIAGARGVEVIEGAARPGVRTAAAQAIAALPDGTEILALGPLTNLAAALAIDPTLAARVAVRAVGGNLSSRGRFAPWWPFEFNFAKDAPAARALFAAPLRRRIFPLDVLRRFVIGPRALLALGRGTPLGRHLAHGSVRWMLRALLRYQSPRLRFPLWDLVPALDLLGLLPARFESRRLRVVGRGGLAPGALPSEFCVAIGDGAAALRAFLALLAA